MSNAGTIFAIRFWSVVLVLLVTVTNVKLPKIKTGDASIKNLVISRFMVARIRIFQ